jgi:outer membrane biosynthesis protein TonB
MRTGTGANQQGAQVRMKAMFLSVLATCSIAAVPAIAREPQAYSPTSFNREAVEIEFDRNKGSLYRLYASALRERPGLSGKLVLEFDINSAGKTTACRVKSSELKAPDLERKICERVATFTYPPQAATTITKPIDFFPAR